MGCHTTLFSAMHEEVNVSSEINQGIETKPRQIKRGHQHLQTLQLASSLPHPADRIVEGFWLQKESLPWAAVQLLSPSLPAAGATKARCFVAPPPSVPPLSLPGRWCPERRMTNASASAYWRIWTTWLQPHTVPTASTRCWLNGRGLAEDGPICVCIEKIWQSCVSV